MVRLESAIRHESRVLCAFTGCNLRSTAATLALMQGEDAKVVLDLLGNGIVGRTLDTYSHLLPAMHQQAASAMDAILAG